MNYLRIAGTSLLLFCGVILGFLLADTILIPSGNPEQATYLPPEDLILSIKDMGMYTSIDVGDALPDAACIFQDGRHGEFSELLSNSDGDVILLFTHFDCTRCVDLLTFWRSRISPHLQSDIAEVVCLAQDSIQVPREFRDLLAGFDWVIVDYETMLDRYGIRVWPTIISVRPFGEITGIQIGFPGKVDRTFLELYLKASYIERR